MISFYPRSSLFILIIICISFLLGCSSQHDIVSVDVTTPDLPAAFDNDTAKTDRSLFGLYHIFVDVPTQTVEIAPVRRADLDLHVNLNPYLISEPCRDCLRLDSVGFDEDENLFLDFALTHAFQDVSVRPDLNGFDLRGILALPATKIFPLTPHTKSVFDPITHLIIRGEQPITLNPGALINADGYTPLWDFYADMPDYAGAIPGSLNPFINYFWEDNPDPIEEGNLIPWRTFAVGGGWDVKRYVLDLTKLDETFDFYFIADVTYGQSATWKTRQNPFYRNPQFNIKEAYDVTVEVDSGLVTGDVLTTCDLTIYVKDWQAGAPLVVDPQNPEQYEIDAVSDVFRLTIDAPDFQYGLIALDTPDSGAGTEADPWVYTTQLRNLQAATTGVYPVLIGIEDDLNETDLLDLRVFELVFPEVFSSHVVINFNPPERVTNNEHASFLWPKEAIALDSANRPHVVWTDDRTGYHQVYYSYRIAQGNWSEPENISQSDGQAYYATVAIDANNHGHIVWEDTDGLIEGLDIHYGYKIGAGLEHNINLTKFSEQGVGVFPKVVVDATGNPHIVWSESTSGDDDFDVRYMHIDMSGPMPSPDYTQLIGQTDAFEGQPSIALGMNDAPRVVFIREDGEHKLFFTKKDTGSFSEPSLIDNGPAYWPDLIYTFTNMGTVCFHGGNMATTQILAMNTVNDGATWSDIIAITDAADMHHVIPDISYDSYNAVHIVWHEIDPMTQIPGQVKYVQLTTEGVTDQQFVTPVDYPSAFPSLVVDADDEVHVAVQTFTDDNYEIYYLTSRD